VNQSILASSLAFHPARPDEALKRALALGYQGLEVLCDPPWHPRGWPPRLVRALAARRDAVLSLHAPIADVNLISPHPEARAFAEAELARTLVLAARLGARGMTFHIGYRSTGVPYDPPWEETKAAIRRLSARARALGVTIALENDPKSPYALLWDLELFGELLAELGIPGTLDLGHAWIAYRKQVFELIPRLVPLVHTVHLHDNRGDRDEHLGLGEGTLDLGRAWPLLAGVPVVVLEVNRPAGLTGSLELLRHL